MFWDNFVLLCDRTGKSPNAVAAEIGFKSTGTVTGWKDGKIPYERNLKKIAEYFGVTVDYLLTGEKEKAPDSVGGLQVTPKKRELIDKVMKMDDKQLDLLEKLLDATEQATK